MRLSKKIKIKINIKSQVLSIHRKFGIKSLKLKRIDKLFSNVPTNSLNKFRSFEIFKEKINQGVKCFKKSCFQKSLKKLFN